MVDMTGLPSGLTAADFEFRAGNLGSPAGWGAGPAAGFDLRAARAPASTAPTA